MAHKLIFVDHISHEFECNMKQEGNMNHPDLRTISAPSDHYSDTVIKEMIESMEPEMGTDDRFTVYVFRGHSQSLLNEDRKEIAVLGFLRDEFQVDIPSVPDNVLKLCHQCYVCQEEDSHLTNFGKIIEAIKIYRHQLKWMHLIQDQERVIQNLMMHYDTGVNRSTRKDINDENLEMVRKAEALAQRCILENYQLRRTIAKITVLVCHLIVRSMKNE